MHVFFNVKLLNLSCNALLLLRGSSSQYLNFQIKQNDGTNKLRSLAYYRMHEDKVIRIQRAWRQHKNDADFRAILMQGDGSNMSNVSVAQVRRYLHLLDLSRDDFDQELELQNLKGEITKRIRMNSQL